MPSSTGDDELQGRLAAARAAGDAEAVGTACFDLGQDARRRGDHTASLNYFDSAVGAFQRSGSQHKLVVALNNAGLAAKDGGNTETALQRLGLSATLAAQAGDLAGAARALGNLAGAAQQRDRFDVAERTYRQAYDLSRLMGDPVRGARALVNLAENAMLSGDFSSAQEWLVKGVRVLLSSPDPQLQGVATVHQARLDLRWGRFAEARREVDWAEATFVYRNDREWSATAAFNRGCIAWLSGDHAGGAALMTAAAASMGSATHRTAAARRLLGTAVLAARDGSMEEARDLARHAQAAARAAGREDLQEVAGELIQATSGSPLSPALEAAGTALRAGEDEDRELARAPLDWLDHRYGEPPSTAVLQMIGGLPHVGPIRLLDLTAQGHGWSCLQDVSELLGVESNYEASDAVSDLIRRRDPALHSRLSFDPEADNFSVGAANRDDLVTALGWLLTLRGPGQ